MFENITVSEIVLAIHVMPGSSTPVHKNRPSHGFVLYAPESEFEIRFSDGTVIHARENDFIYLPKGSSYEVKTGKRGSCYAINFDAEFSGKPFSISFRNSEKLFKLFRAAEKEWLMKTPVHQAFIKKCIYEIIIMLSEEQQKNYLPGKKEQIIMPALKKIDSDFAQPSLSISELSEMCGISEVYFRRIFMDKFGVSPKEYIITKRINHAGDLLKSGLFTVSEVAMLCGYAEPCHFSREFKKRTGENPNNFK